MGGRDEWVEMHVFLQNFIAEFTLGGQLCAALVIVLLKSQSAMCFMKWGYEHRIEQYEESRGIRGYYCRVQGHYH